MTRTKLRSKFFLVKYSSIWNKLPQNVRETESLPLFKKRVSVFLTTKNIMALFGNCDEDLLYEEGPDYI
jgi:hypothetical protein